MRVLWAGSGEKSQGDSQSDFLASIVFSDSFSLKYFMSEVAIFEGRVSRTPSSAVGLQRVCLLFGGDSAELLTYPLTPSPPLRLFSRYVLSVHTRPEPSGAWRSGVEGTKARGSGQVKATDLTQERPAFRADFPILLCEGSSFPRPCSGCPRSQRPPHRPLVYTLPAHPSSQCSCSLPGCS